MENGKRKEMKKIRYAMWNQIKITISIFIHVYFEQTLNCMHKHEFISIWNFKLPD